MSNGFVELVREAFNYLTLEYSYSCAESTASYVKFSSSSVFLTVEYDHLRSYEISCSIGRLDDFKGSLRVPFNLGEIIRSKGVLLDEARSSFQVSDANILKEKINELARNFEIYGSDLFTGDLEAFVRVYKQRDFECNEYAAKKEVAEAREISNKAWLIKSYTDVVNALSPVREYLSPADIKRLEYAEKHR
ncbi:MAG: hypothetical protein HRU15_20445 [Planctomycetes bacterium]|nr:hypothetical protein [Planctomycetota bacterium]